MHRAIEALPRAYFVCHLSDKLSVMNGLKPSRQQPAPTNWGYVDEFVPAKRQDTGHEIVFQRDVFLRPTSDTEMDYVLGFKDEFDIDPEEVYVVFRAEYVIKVEGKDPPPSYERFPITIFYEAVKDRWRMSAKLTEVVLSKRILRPKAWKGMLDEHGLGKAKARARPIKNTEGMPHVQAMMRLVAKYAGTRQRLVLE